MQKILFFLFIFICITPAYNQTNLENIDSINTKIEEYSVLAHTSPVDAKNKLSDLKKYCEKINYQKGIMFCSRGLVLMYYNDGNYKKAIEESRIIEKYAKILKQMELLADTYRMRAISYSEIGFSNEALNELKKASQYGEKIEIPVMRFYKKALIYESYAGVYSKKEDTDKQLFYRQKSIAETKKMPEIAQGAIEAKYQNLAYQYSSIGLLYSNLKVNDSANYYFEKALELTENIKYGIYTNVKATLLSDMANFYLSNQKYHEAISFAKRAESLEKTVSLPYIKRDIFGTLFKSYIKTDRKDSSVYYFNLYTSLNDSLLKSEKESIMTPVKQIISDNETKNRNTVRNVAILSIATIVILILTGVLYWKSKNKIIHKKYEALIEKINTEKNYNYAKLTVNITDETTKKLFQQLEKFEKSDKYLRKDMSRSWLAKHLNTNNTYLTEVIRVKSNLSYTDYIHELRIGYITRKLVENPIYREYKIEHLANECGYGSRQVFITAFKKETGFTPSYFIENLKKEGSN